MNSLVTRYVEAISLLVYLSNNFERVDVALANLVCLGSVDRLWDRVAFV